ncbi:MAG TPA: hypothetical protein VF809_03200 [Candidatus Saccharimonadales bacterium]
MEYASEDDEWSDKLYPTMSDAPLHHEMGPSFVFSPYECGQDAPDTGGTYGSEFFNVPEDMIMRRGEVVSAVADENRVDFDEFSRVCTGQRITLPDEVIIAGLTRYPSNHSILDPSGMFAVIGIVAQLRREYPDLPLLERPIDASVFGDNVPARTVVDMLNASLLTQAEHQASAGHSPVPSFALGTEPIDVCDNAEPRFGVHLDDATRLGWCVSTVFEEEGVPIFYRKDLGAESAIAMTDIRVGGTVFGRGFLMRIVAECDGPDYYGSDVWSRHDHSLVYPTSEIIAVTPMRPSSFGLPPKQRAFYFSGEKQESARFTVDDFVQKSQGILDTRRRIREDPDWCEW